MIKSKTFTKFDPASVPSPCFVVDEVALEQNLETLKTVADKSGAKILLALKAFSMIGAAPLVKKYLHGVCASGLHEALLGHQEFGGAEGTQEVHTFCPAFKEDELKSILNISNHIVFNSLSQWQKYKTICLAAAKTKTIKFGLRINPEHSEGTVPIYDPCAPCSRLGIPANQLVDADLEGISGLHFHTLCEQGCDALERTLEAVQEKFGHLFSQISWVNFGGGHHITAPEYDRKALVKIIKQFKKDFELDVYLEPGEAIAINTGVLVAEVLDIGHNAMNLAILDTSATCHMPDTLEMPYRPNIFGSSDANIQDYTYRLGGQTCLAGDVIGDYSFKQALQIGQRLIFDDMAHYTMVKTTTFNGINLPSIALWNSHTQTLSILRQFGYSDFMSRL